MIAIISGTYKEAKSWAKGQLLEDDEWFYVNDIDDLINRTNFHVLVVGTADEINPHHFEKLFSLARKKGKTK
jgi:hypothetical protein